ncbi:hypothetical protein, partial [Lactococcus lactis]|uniref:hypothetical protein n=1 Tax=Lactococcus lactis TaxID=1358 RepID=UPI001967EFA8
IYIGVYYFYKTLRAIKLYQLLSRNIKYIGGGQKLYYLYYLYSFEELQGFVACMKSIFFEVKTIFFCLFLIKSLEKIKKRYKTYTNTNYTNYKRNKNMKKARCPTN